MSILNEISELVCQGDTTNIKVKVESAINDGIDAKSILDEGLIAGINIIGDLFAKNEVFVPEVLLAAKTMNDGVDVIKPILEKSGIKPIGKVIIGTVKGDLHDIGKNLVALMMNSTGIEVINLGSNVSSDQFVDAVKQYNPDIVCLSALLTTTMNEQKNVIDALADAGVRNQVKVMIGGAPVTQMWCDKIKADAFTADAAEAAKWAKNYVLTK